MASPETTEDEHGVARELLEPDEAPTPAWLPLVGLGVLFAGLIALLTPRPVGTSSPGPASSHVSSAEPSADPPPAPVPRERAALPARPSQQPAGCGQ